MTRRLYVLAFAVAAIFMAGCRKNTEDHFMDAAKAKGWTQDQAEVAFPEGEKSFHLRKAGDVFEYNYGVLTTVEVRQQVDEFRRDYAAILDYKDEEASRYLEVYGLRKHFEQREELWEAVGARILLAELFEKFRSFMGVGMTFDDPELAEAHIGRFNLKKIFTSGDTAKAFPFASSQVEEARKQGRLKPIEEVEAKVVRPYDRKELDPAHLEDPNEFIWRDYKAALKGTSYKILDADKPKDNFSNYIEVFRVNVNDGKPESSPAIRVFFPNSGAGVIVVDTDQEGRDPGYGLPDLVAPTGHRSVQDVMDDKQLLRMIFLAKEKQHRIPPVKKKVYMEIVKVGDGSAVDPWEKAPDAAGFSVPGSTLEKPHPYRNATGKNFNVKLKFTPREKPQSGDDTQMLLAKQIESFIKEWTGGSRYAPSEGQVKEYYRPKPDFAQRSIEKAEVDQYKDTKRVVVTFTDGTERNGMVTAGSNQFTEDEPWAIEYTDGTKRFRIEKSQGSKVFDRRRQIAPAKRDTGVYGANGGSESSSGFSNGSDGGEHVHQTSQAIP